MKIKGALFAAILAAVLCVSGNVFAALSGGGTQGNPYLIQSRGDFDEFANPANAATYWASGIYTKLMCDLNLASTTYTQAVIAPSSGTTFSGTFDGNGCVISNLTIAASAQDYVGLFGYVGSGGQIKNLGAENANITGNSMLGILAAQISQAYINSCYATGSVSGKRFVGGLIGYSYSGSLTLCHTAASVSGTEYVGGLVGWTEWGVFYSCYTTGPVTGTVFSVGGLIGDNYKGSPYFCYATGLISGYDSVGGLVGTNGGSPTACYATGNVGGTSVDSTHVGGLVGWNYDRGIASCYATGTVVAYSYVGGLVGYIDVGTITASYSTGAVSGTDYVGGMLGGDAGGTITSCFWDMVTSDQPTSAGGTGKVTSDMQMHSTFISAGWDFTNETNNGTKDYWRMCVEGVGYPRLNWESITGDLACPDGVDFVDFAVFAARWSMATCNLSNNFCGGADINYSGTVDFADFTILAANWLEGI